MKAGEILELEAQNKTFSHAYLLIGNNQSEIDKIVNGFISAKNCRKEDISVLRADLDADGKGSEIKIDDVRKLLHEINLSPQGECRIAIIYNAEMLNQSSGNILLKTLEEPPKTLSVVLVSSTEMVLPTVKSRCRILKVGAAPDASSENEFSKLFEDYFFEASMKIEEITKKNQTEAALRDVIGRLRSKLLAQKDKNTALAIKQVMEVKKRIRQNANPRLALESLYLSIKNEF